MPTYTISRGRLLVQTTRIEAPNEETALQLAQSDYYPETCWTTCHPETAAEDWNFQTEFETNGAADFSSTTGPTKKLLSCKCPKCGSREIAFDSFVFWNESTQQYEAGGVMDKGHCCNTCGAHDIRPLWEPLAAPPRD